MTFTTDPIISEEDAQAIFDFKAGTDPAMLINSLSAKARAFMQRKQLNLSLTAAIKENFRGVPSPMIFLHAPVHTADFATYDLTVRLYVSGVLDTTYSANDDEVIVTTDDFYSRIDLVDGCFPGTEGASWIEVEYYGGWATIPGDVYAGAIQQGRVELKRLKGEVGMTSHSQGGESIQVDRHGVIMEAAELWQNYRIIV